MSTLQVDRISPYQSSSVQIDGDVTYTGAVSTGSFNTYTASQEAIIATLATTGSNTFEGNQVVSGDITATRMTLTGGAGNDLIVTGSVFASAGILTNGSVQAGASTVKSYLSSTNISTIDNSTSDEIGFTYDTAGWGVSGWTGPSFYLNDPTDSYPAVIGFQNKASWTDGTVSILKPLSVTGSVQVSGSVKQTYPAPGDNQQVDNITITGATVTGTPFNVATFGFQDYGGDAFQDIFAIDFADSFSYNYYNSFYINGKATTFNLVPSGSVGGVKGTMRMRPNGANPTEVDTSIWGDTVYIGSNTNAMTISGSAGIGVDGVVTLNDTLQLTPQDPLPSGVVGELAVSGSSLYFYDGSWRAVSLV